MFEMTELLMILGIGIVFLLLVGAILWDQIRRTRKKHDIKSTSHSSPSSLEPDDKKKMMAYLDKRESQMRRERILEGGNLPELSELVVYSPENGEKVESSQIDVRGKTAIKSIVWINNQAAFVDVDGSFIGSVRLSKGKNKLHIVAIGPYGKSLTSELKISCTARPSEHLIKTESGIILPSSSSEMIPERPVDTDHITPSATVDIQSSSISSSQTSRASSRPKRQPSIPKPNNYSSRTTSPVVVPEEEIDPDILSALRQSSLPDEAPSREQPAISPEEAEEMPIPSIPDVEKEPEETEEEVIIETDEEEIEESVQILEEMVEKEVDEDEEDLMEEIEEEPVEKEIKDESIETIKEESSTAIEETMKETEEPDQSTETSEKEITPTSESEIEEDYTISKDELDSEILAKTEQRPTSEISSTDSAKQSTDSIEVEDDDKTSDFDSQLEEIVSVSEFEPLTSETEDKINLIVKTKTQELEDAKNRPIIIQQHTCFIEREDGELIKILQIEKRIEKKKNQWISTIGIANVSDRDIKLLQISEVISATFKMTEKLPKNVSNPVLDSLSTGYKITWQIHNLKSHRKVFLNYQERLNPIEVVSEEEQKIDVSIVQH
jgi:hypothetical protein